MQSNLLAVGHFMMGVGALIIAVIFTYPAFSIFPAAGDGTIFWEGARILLLAWRGSSGINYEAERFPEVQRHNP